MNEKIDKKFAGLLTVFFLTVGVFFTVILFNNKSFNQIIKASQQLTLSADKSLILAYPLTAKADGIDKVTINVFLRDKNGSPVPNQTVTLNASLGTVNQNPQTSEKDGKTTFILTSTIAGISEITATAGNVALTKKVSVKFE